MPWKVSSPVEQRLAFVLAVHDGDRSLAALCRAFGISRECGYKWLRRYEVCGLDGLRDRSHRALHLPHTVSDKIAGLLVEARLKHPTWGPRTLIARLRRKHPDRQWPAASTVGELLKRKGLVGPKSTRQQVLGPRPCVNPQQPNDVWSADFKGHFPTADGQRCHPLTISDAYSRYLLRCQALSSTHEQPVRRVFEEAFEEFGLPTAIRTDNGTPFSGVGGLSRLSVWWVKLGIKLERIKPGRPQQNGRHERIHRTLQDDVGPGPRTMAEHQRLFDEFVAEYNCERPHQALSMEVPAALYASSPRPLPRKLPQLEYGEGWIVRSVRRNGEMQWRGRRIRLSDALGGETVGLCAIEDGLWAIHFGPLRLAVIDERNRSVYRGT